MIDRERLDTIASVRELDVLANKLGMPDSERRNILGLSETAYSAWHDGRPAVAAPPPELTRRLAYALPLMRRMLANQLPVATTRPAGPDRPRLVS